MDPSVLLRGCDVAPSRSGSNRRHGMKVRAIDFVVVNVSDVQRSVAFYRDTLGMDFPLWEPTARWKELEAPPVALALRQDTEGAGGNAAIALAVDDVPAALEELRAKGVKILTDV